MIHRWLLGSVALLLGAAAMPAHAQFIDPELSVGAGGGGFLAQTDDFNAGLRVRSKIQFGAQVFVRHGIISRVQGELNIQLGKIAGQTATPYTTTLIPASLRVLVSPWELEKFNPYLYAGYGVIRYKVNEHPNTSPTIDYPFTEGWAAFVPAGIGLQVRLDDHFSLEASGGPAYSFNDNLDWYFDGRLSDGLWGAMLGVTYTVATGTTDSDGDSLLDKLERQIGTNPRIADSDGDGLPDGAEYNTHKTSPRSPDSDRDGLSDGDEILNYRTNPLQPDTDSDGLSDREEVIGRRTDPLAADTDKDGLNDGEEVSQYRTDPVKSDTDMDGLSDGEEVNRYKTNPLRGDTDAGGVSDSAEIARGTNPLNSSDDVRREEPKVGKRIVLEGVNFRTGSAELSAGSVAKLEEVFLTLRDNPEIEVEISGHTDNTGKRSTNVRLSKSRADAVKEYLGARGIDPRRIRTVGNGPDRPVATNATEEGRAKNRRIEFSRIR